MSTISPWAWCTPASESSSSSKARSSSRSSASACRPGNTKAVQSHGNTKLEIAWTFIPAVILAFIAVPTVRMIFVTQAPAPAGALEVEVIGHQWWWEFRYPEYKIVTANELYLPVGRPVTFSLRTNDVLHSFWIPQLNGKRDLISNHTNHLWFTPDSIGAYNGFCAEFCGTSHANMRFKAFAVSAEQFAEWAAHEQTGAVFPAPVDTTPPAKPAKGAPAAAPAPAPMPVAMTTTGTWPKDKLPVWVVPATPTPHELADPHERRRRARRRVLQDRAVHRVPHRAGRLGRHHRPQPHARRQPHLDWRRPLSERSRASHGLDQGRAR